MKRLLWFTGLLVLFEIAVFAQKRDPVVMTVNGRPISRTEFEISYRKSADLESGRKLSVRDFMKSYIDFQLAVEEAYAQKMDTASAFCFQRSTYRSSIAADYMRGKAEGYDKCLKMLVEYLKYDVELNHVLIPFESEKVLSVDTLSVYNAAKDEYGRLSKSGFIGGCYVDNTSERNVVRDYSNLKGYLGWVIPGMFPPEIEDALYSLSVGEVSRPIRSSKGYHIVQVLNRRPAEGARRVDHVYFAFSHIPPSQAEIDSVMGVVDKLLSSSVVNFDVLCQSFSEAYKTGNKGCSFAPFGLNSELPLSLIAEAYRLKDIGEVSKPVVSNTGVHLMRLVQKLPMPDTIAEDVAAQLLATKGRMFHVLLENHRELFAKYDLEINNEAYQKIEKLTEAIFPTDSLFVPSINNKEEILFHIEDSVSVNVKKFAEYLTSYAEYGVKSNTEESLVNFFGGMPEDPFNLSSEKLYWLFSQFAFQTLREHVFETLEQRYPEMKSKVNVFASELLVYGVKEKEIYSRVPSSEELGMYFEKNRRCYKWNIPRFKGVMVVCPDEESYVRLKGMVDSVKDYKDVDAIVKEDIERYNYSVQPRLIYSIWEEGDDLSVDKVIFKKKVEDGDKYVLLKGVRLKAPESLEDVRSEVLTDYQSKLEQEWLESLREKYEVVINENNLKGLK